MNDIDKMPPKCRDCPYWELASYPWCCGDCADEMNPKNSEYIKRIDAKRALTALPADLDAETVQRCIEAINNPKAADVEPKRKTGVWLEEEATDDGNWRYICSVCGYADIQSRSAQVPYCWHCGSRMQKMSEVADNGSVQ